VWQTVPCLANWQFVECLVLHHEVPVTVAPFWFTLGGPQREARPGGAARRLKSATARSPHGQVVLVALAGVLSSGSRETIVVLEDRGVAGWEKQVFPGGQDFCKLLNTYRLQ
jgi:hypothetical protein